MTVARATGRLTAVVVVARRHPGGAGRRHRPDGPARGRRGASGSTSADGGRRQRLGACTRTEPLPDLRLVRDVAWADATTLAVLGSRDGGPVAPFYVDIDGYDVVDVEPLAGPGEHHRRAAGAAAGEPAGGRARRPASCCSSPRAAAGSRSAPAPTRPTPADRARLIVPRPGRRPPVRGGRRPAARRTAARWSGDPRRAARPARPGAARRLRRLRRRGVAVVRRRAPRLLAGPARPCRPDPCPAGLPPTWAVAGYDGAVAGRGARAQGARRARR